MKRFPHNIIYIPVSRYVELCDKRREMELLRTCNTPFVALVKDYNSNEDMLYARLHDVYTDYMKEVFIKCDMQWVIDLFEMNDPTILNYESN